MPEAFGSMKAPPAKAFTERLALWFNFYDGRIGIILEVGPNDKFSREVLVKALQEYFNSKAKIYPKYTRVYSRYIKLTEDQLSNSEEIIAAMESLYKETADKHLMSVVGIVGKFFGGLSHKQSK
jgi:hypothetical protein